MIYTKEITTFNKGNNHFFLNTYINFIKFEFSIT